MEIKTAIEKIEAHRGEFEKYYTWLIEYNSKVNLTAITEKNEVYVKHFLDSILPIAEIKPGARVIDVGTGAGFPSLPIKIVKTDIDLTMVDSLNKRINFLDEVVAGLGIKNAKAVHSRAEDFCQNNREKFDVAVARAVAKLNTLLEYLLPLVKVGGIVLAYKGSGYADELKDAQKAIETLGGKVEKVLTYNLPTSLDETQNNSKNENFSVKIETLGERNIIVIKKIKPTPKQYPRSQNKPKTQPIC